MNLAVIGNVIVRLGTLCEAVGEYLIHHAALEPVRCGHSLLVDRELEKVAVVDNALARTVALDVVSVVVDK